MPRLSSHRTEHRFRSKLVNATRKRSRHRSRRQVVVLTATSFLAMLTALAIIAPVAAAEFVTGDNPRIPASTTLDDDLYLAGDQAIIAGTVTGDALVASRNLDLSGTVERSLAVAANEAVISGDVGHAVRAAVNELRITGNVGGDLVAFASSIVVEPGATIAGDLIAAGGDVDMQGEVGGDLRLSAGTVFINGPVDGDVDVTVDNLELGPQARVTGDLEYASDSEADIDPQAQVTGNIDREDPEARSLDNAAGSVGGGAIGELFRLLAALVAGLVVVLVMPRATVSVAESVRRRTGPSILLGLILLFAVPIATIILMVTVIGIPIGLISLATYLILLYLSQVFVGTAIGRWILPRSWGDDGRGFNLLAMALGVILLGALRLVPVPTVDFLIAAVTAMLGLGAVFIGMRRRPSPAIPPYSQSGRAY
jgi:cytoskeletal protein CcmA (bactofilin family)